MERWVWALVLGAIAPAPTLAATGLPALIGLAAVLVVALLTRPQRTFRRRLWNDRVFDLTPDDLVAPSARS